MGGSASLEQFRVVREQPFLLGLAHLWGQQTRLGGRGEEGTGLVGAQGQQGSSVVGDG